MQSAQDQALPLQKRHILIVDADDEVRASLSQRLTLEGYCVVLAATGAAALDIVAHVVVDLVLLEVHLGAQYGLEVLRACQQLRPQLVGVLMTAQPSADTAIAALQVGVYAYLRKPLVLEALCSTLADCFIRLDRERARSTAEAALRASEERYRTLVEGSLQGLSMVCQGRRVFANTAYARLLGYDTPADIIGLDPMMHIAVHERDRLRQHVTAVMRGEVISTRYEYEGITKDGTPIWLEAHFAPAVWEGHVALQVTLQDVTERKQAEHERHALEAQLRQLQKMQAIGTLAGGIAHDFNNLLTPILGYVEMAMEDLPPGGALANDLQHVLKAAKRAKELVQQMLLFSRRGEPKRQPVSLDSIVTEVLPFLRASFPSTIRMQTRFHPACGAILADPTQIHQVLLNLCTNAAQAMSDAGGVLEITLEPLAQETAGPTGQRLASDTPAVCLSVRDTGTGIDHVTMERIFEPFFTTKQVGSGTGLGLAVVHGIVADHGGSIAVESVPGQGTTFRVSFPCVASTAAPSLPVEKPALAGHGRVLLVDDELMVAEAIHLMLAHMGYTVTMQTSSRAALALFTAQPEAFDLVLTDQTMPEMTGIQFAQALRALRPNIPIILMTGYSEAALGPWAQDHALDAHLLKPFQVRELHTVLQQVVRGMSS